VKWLWVVGAVLAMIALIACGDKRPHSPPAAESSPVLEQALDHYSECLSDEAPANQSCTSCHAGGEPGESVAKVLVEGQYVDLCMPGLM
jgi:hypothetical protein